MRKYRKYVICCSLTLTRLDGVTTTTLSISGVAATVHNTFSDLYYNVFMSVCVCSIELYDSHTIRALSLQRTQNQYIKIFYKNIHYYWMYNCPRPSIQLVEGTPGLRHYKLVSHLLTLLQIVPDFPLKMYSIFVLLNWTLSSHILK